MKPLRQFHGSPLRKWTAVFFVLVMTGFGYVQAVHAHDVLKEQTSPAAHCSLCVVAHSAAVTTPVSAVQAPIVESAAFVQADPQLQSRLQVPSAFIRPPPQSL
jgi:hypothetical protein